MTHNWLCFWVKQIPNFHTRFLSTFSHHLLGRNNGLSGDVACLQSATEQVSSHNELILNTERLNGSPNCSDENAKRDFVSSKSWPLIGVRNQELITCLRKMIKPVQNIETIHVSKTVDKDNEMNVTNDLNEVSKFSTFCSFDEPFNKDLHTMQSNCIQTRSAKTSTKSVSEFSKEPDDEENDDDSNRKGPTIAQLEEVKRFYIRSAPHFFRRGEPMNEGRHDPNIIFENHLRKRSKTTVGIKRYLAELSKIRIIVGIMYPSCSLRIRNINIHPENGYVRIHWCALYTTDILIWSRFFSFFSSVSKSSNDTEKKRYRKEWDFISTVYLNKDGKIVKHIVDRKIPVNEKMGTVENFAVNTVGKLGLTPKATYKDHREDPAT